MSSEQSGEKRTSPTAAVNQPSLVELWSRRALEVAASAVESGNHPFGALLAVDGNVVCEAENTVNTDGDATCHAETNLLRKMARGGLATSDTLKRATLVTSTEPCMMCAAAMYWAGIESVVYVTAETTLAKHAGEDFLKPCREVFGVGGRAVNVIGPTMDEEGGKLHAAYWPKLKQSQSQK